jgi:hypothetical protein
LNKAQTIFVSIAIALVLGAIGFVAYQGMSRKDLSSELRQQYSAEKNGVLPAKKENTDNEPIVEGEKDPTADLITDPAFGSNLTNGTTTAGNTTISTTPAAGVTNNPRTTTSTAPTIRQPDNYTVKTDERGAVKEVLPPSVVSRRDSDFDNEQNLPQISSPSFRPQERDYKDEEKEQDARYQPPPADLLDQSPPDLIRSQDKKKVASRVTIRPRRYLFNNMADTAVQGAAIGNGSSDQVFNLQTFSPMGEDIQLALMNNASSKEGSVSVVAGVWYPFYFQGRKLLEIGDKLLGSGSRATASDRMNITFNRIIFKDGRSMSISATGLNTDGTTAVQGIRIGDPFLDSLGPILIEAIGDVADAFTTRTQQSASVQVVSGNNDDNSNVDNRNLRDKIADALGQSTKNATQKMGDLLEDEINENKPYVLVPAGTRLKARLNAPLDTSNADYGK